jgi:quercetin dioxygenase-like cupin family protein
MNDQSKTARPARMVHANPETAKKVPGRRAFFSYTDLGVTDATDGFMRAQLTTADKGMTESTGWHYHECEAQFVYCTSGWVDLEFETGETVRVKKGESIFIPGGMKHNELRTSDDFQILEVSVPADMGTVPCEKP